MKTQAQFVELAASELLDVQGGWFAHFFGKLRDAVAELTKNPIVIPSDTTLYIPQ
jgi:hypothetical protein